MKHSLSFSPSTMEALDRAERTAALQIKPEYDPSGVLPMGQIIHLTNKAVELSESFPYQSTANLVSVTDEQTREWLYAKTGDLGVGWAIVPQYPNDNKDTFFFKCKEHALWFKLAFS